MDLSVTSPVGAGIACGLYAGGRIPFPQALALIFFDGDAVKLTALQHGAQLVEPYRRTANRVSRLA